MAGQITDQAGREQEPKRSLAIGAGGTAAGIGFMVGFGGAMHGHAGVWAGFVFGAIMAIVLGVPVFLLV